MKKLLAAAIILWASLAMAQVQRNRTLTWDYPDQSQITGFRLYWGTAPGGPYTLGKIEILKGQTTASVQLPRGTYYFVCTAFNPDSESEFSNEATTTIYDNAMKPINLTIRVGP